MSVVVPCRNEIHHIHRFLDSVFLQDMSGLNVEVLIADGMSDDGTRQVLDRFLKDYEIRYGDHGEQQFDSDLPAFFIMDNLGKIASTGLNAAIRTARGEIVIRMDVHTEYAPDYIQNCVTVLNETNADNVGGPSFTRADGYLAQAIALGFHLRFACGGARFRDTNYEGYVDTVTYGCWKRSTLHRIGLFDERLCRNQDGELNMRLISFGGKIWQSPTITSWYRPRSTLESLFRQYFQYGFWKMSVIRKHRKLAAWRNLVPAMCMLVGILLLLGAATASARGSAWWASEFLRIELGFGGSYLAASLTTAFLAARRSGWRFLPVLPVVFATYHLSYGLGFLLAIIYRPVWDRPSYTQKIPTAISR